MSTIESNINKIVENLLTEPEPTVIIKEEKPKAPRDINIIIKPELVKMPISFAKTIVEKALETYADPSGNWFRRYIRNVKNPQLHIDLNTVLNGMVKSIIKEDDETSFAFGKHKQQLTMQAMGSLSDISDTLWQRMTQTVMVETKTTETKDGKERIIIERNTMKPALDHLGWELADRGIEYMLEGKFICHLQQIEGRAAVFNSSLPVAIAKPEKDEEGFETVRHKQSDSTKPNYRTVPCKFFTETGVCKFGSKCDFLHISTEQTKPCNFGDKCNRKDTCKYNHESTVAAASIAGTYAAKAAEPTKLKPTTGFTGKVNAGAGKV